MSNKSPTVVHIGNGPACFTKITPLKVDYFDEKGQEGSIDLRECARNWCWQFDENRDNIVVVPSATPESVSQWNARCVGMREPIDAPPWVLFVADQQIQFEFDSVDDLEDLLLIPLQKAGWHTFDAS